MPAPPITKRDGRAAALGAARPTAGAIGIRRGTVSGLLAEARLGDFRRPAAVPGMPLPDGSPVSADVTMDRAGTATPDFSVDESAEHGIPVTIT